MSVPRITTQGGFNGHTIVYQGDGSATMFNYPGSLVRLEDLVVFTIDPNLATDDPSRRVSYTPGTDYTATAGTVGATVTFVTAPADGLEVSIQNAPEISQLLDLQRNTPYDPEELENALDKLTIIIQVLHAQLTGDEEGVEVEIIPIRTDGVTTAGDGTISDPVRLSAAYKAIIDAIGAGYITNIEASGDDLIITRSDGTTFTITVMGGSVDVSVVDARIAAHNTATDAHDDRFDTKMNIDGSGLTPAQLTAAKSNLEIPDQAGMGISEADVDTKISDHNTAADAHDTTLLDVRGARLADDLTEAETTAILGKLNAAREVRLVTRDPRPFTNEMGFADITVVESGGVTVTTGTKPFFSTRDDIASITVNSTVINIDRPKRNLITPPDFITDIMAYQDNDVRWYVLYHKAVDVPQRHVIIIDDDGSGEEAYLIRQTSTETVTVTLDNGESIEMVRYEYADDNEDWPTSFTIDENNPPVFDLSQWSIDGHILGSQSLDAIDYPNKTLAFRIVSTTNIRSMSAFYKHPDTSSWERLFVLVGASGDIVDVEDEVAELNRNKADRDAGNLQSFHRPAWEAYLGLSQYLNNRFTNVPTDPTAISQDIVDRLIAILRGPFEQKFLKGDRDPNRHPVFIGRGNTVNANDTAVLSTSPNIGFAGLTAITRTDSDPANNITRNIRANVLGTEIPLIITFHTDSTGTPFNYLFYPSQAPDGRPLAGSSDIDNYPLSFDLEQLNDDGTVDTTFSYNRAGGFPDESVTYNIVTDDHPNGITRNASSVPYAQAQFATTVPDLGRPFRITNVVLPASNVIGDHPVTFDDTEVPAIEANPGDVYRQNLNESSSEITVQDWQKNNSGEGWKAIDYQGDAFDPSTLEAEVATLTSNVATLSGAVTSNTVNKQNRDWSNTVDRSAVTDANFLRLVNLIFSGLTEAQRTIVLDGLFPDTLTTAQKDRALQIFRDLPGVEKVSWWDRLLNIPISANGRLSARTNEGKTDLEYFEALTNNFDNIGTVADSVIDQLRTLLRIDTGNIPASAIFFGTSGVDETTGEDSFFSAVSHAMYIWTLGSSASITAIEGNQIQNPDTSLMVATVAGETINAVLLRHSSGMWLYVEGTNRPIGYFPASITVGSETFNRGTSLASAGTITIDGVATPTTYVNYSGSATGSPGDMVPSLSSSGGQVSLSLAPNSPLVVGPNNSVYIRLRGNKSIELYRNQGTEANPNFTLFSFEILLFTQNPNDLIENYRVGDPEPLRPLAVTDDGTAVGWAFSNDEDITGFDLDGTAVDKLITGPAANVSITRNGTEVDAGVFAHTGNSYKLYIYDSGYVPELDHFPREFRGWLNDGRHALFVRGTDIETAYIFEGATRRDGGLAHYHKTYGPDIELTDIVRWEQIDSQNPGSTIKIAMHVATEARQVFNNDSNGTSSEGVVDQVAIETTHNRTFLGQTDDDGLFSWKDTTHIPVFTDEDPNEFTVGAQPYESQEDANGERSFVYLADSYPIDNIDNISWQLGHSRHGAGRTFTIAQGQELREDRLQKTQRPDWDGLHWFITYSYHERRCIVTKHYNEQERSLSDVTGNQIYDDTLGITFTVPADYEDTSANFGRFGTDNSTGVIAYTHQNANGDDITVDSYEEFLERYRPHERKKIYDVSKASPSFSSPPENPVARDGFEVGDKVLIEEDSGESTEKIKNKNGEFTVTGRSNGAFVEEGDEGLTVTEHFEAGGSSLTQGFQGPYLGHNASDYVFFLSSALGRDCVLRGRTYDTANFVPDDYVSNFNLLKHAGGTTTILRCAVIFSRGAGSTRGIDIASFLVEADGITDTDHDLWGLITGLRVTTGNTVRTAPVNRRDYVAPGDLVGGQSPFNIGSGGDTPVAAIDIQFDERQPGNDITDLDLRGIGPTSTWSR